MIELTKLKPLEEAEVHIMHPVTGEDTDIKFVVCGTDSKQYRQVARDVMAKQMDEDKSDYDLDEIEILSKCVIKFSGIMINGKVIEHNLDNTKMILNEYPWIKEQINSFMVNKSNFFSLT